MQTTDVDVEYILLFVACKILCIVHFAKDVEDWFVYNILKVFLSV